MPAFGSGCTCSNDLLHIMRGEEFLACEGEQGPWSWMVRGMQGYGQPIELYADGSVDQEFCGEIPCTNS